jgi:carbonic anhydrase
VVRVAGNVASSEAIGSLEFATGSLGAKLILVLGHTKCGAVKAAVANQPLPGRLSSFAEDIKPAIERVRNKPGNLEDNSVISNVEYQVEILKNSPTILGSLMKEGKLKIVGGFYNLNTGAVKLL